MLHCWHGEQFLRQNIRAFLSLEIPDLQAINHVIFIVYTIVFSCLLKKLIMYKKITCLIASYTSVASSLWYLSTMPLSIITSD